MVLIELIGLFIQHVYLLKSFNVDIFLCCILLLYSFDVNILSSLYNCICKSGYD